MERGNFIIKKWRKFGFSSNRELSRRKEYLYFWAKYIHLYLVLVEVFERLDYASVSAQLAHQVGVVVVSLNRARQPT